MATCVRCRKSANPAFSIQHDDDVCKHWTHVDCGDNRSYDELDFDKCDACLGKIDSSAPLLPEHEPTTKDGRDYIGDPLEQGVFSKLRRKVPSVFSRDQTKKTSLDPFYLLRMGPLECPVDWIMREKNLGLQHMLSQGVTIDDFVNNGYDWDQLKLFKDLSVPGKGKERRILTLQALKVTPEHFRTFPTALPVQAMELTGQDLKNYFDLQFPQDGPMLTSPASDDWRAADVVRMGLKMGDLVDMGMCYLEHYMNLEPNEQEERALDANITQIQTLKMNSDALAAHVAAQEEEEKRQQQQQQKHVIPTVPTAAGYMQIPVPVVQMQQSSFQVIPTQKCYISEAARVKKISRENNKQRRQQRGIHKLSDE